MPHPRPHDGEPRAEPTNPRDVPTSASGVSRRLEPTPDPPTCRCAPVYLGMTFSGSWNLSPTCPSHGEGTSHWNDVVSRVRWPWLRAALESPAAPDPARRDDDERA